jgi:nicotinamide-nucleotide amidase
MLQHHRTAAIMSVGDELILGQTLDTNSRWLSQQVTDLGIMPVRHVTIADDLAAQKQLFLELAACADVVICTGGLGPTADDLTREALALAAGVALEQDPVSLSEIEAWFVARGRTMSAINAVQAMRPKTARAIPNPNGTAPGIVIALEAGGGRRSDIFCLPGPPREMFPMFSSQVVPRLRPDASLAIHTKALHCFGIGESDLATRLGELMNRASNPTVGTTASGGVVSIRIRYRGEAGTDDRVNAMIAAERAARTAGGAYIFGSDGDTLATSVVRSLQENASTLCVAESCTGGGLGAMITQAPGASLVFRGGVLTYANEMKTQLADVPAKMFAAGGPGAVSRECAAAMASGIRAKLGTTHAISITGIAGPGGGSREKPVGTVWIAVASGDAAMDVRRFVFTGERDAIRDMASRSALAMLRQVLIGVKLPMLRQAE